MRCQKKLQIIMPKHRKLLSKLGTWEKPNSSIFFKEQAPGLGGGSHSLFSFSFSKKRKGMDWNVEWVYKLVISFFFFFHCFLFPRKKGMEWNVDSLEDVDQRFLFFIFYFFAFFWLERIQFKHMTKEFLGKKINDPNSPYFEK